MTEIATIDWSGRWGTSVFSAIFLVYNSSPPDNVVRIEHAKAICRH